MNNKVLVVDDEKDVSNPLKDHLGLEGYEVFTTNDPLKAMDIINKNSIKIVISDVTMPGLSGIELLKKIKESNGIIQVIMITGYITIDNLIACLRYGASDCVFKPFESVDELIGAVKEAAQKLEKWDIILKKNISGKI